MEDEVRKLCAAATFEEGAPELFPNSQWSDDAAMLAWIIHKQRKVIQAQRNEVVVTTNDKGECVAVTRQDNEGEIVSVIWERDNG